MIRCLRFACMTLAICCVAVSAMAQTEMGTISGQVTDQSGAAVPGAEVVLVSVDRGTITTVTTNHSGIYLFAAVQPGQYRIAVRKSGFRQVDLLGVLVNVQAHIEQNFRLTVGSTSESVTVSGGASIVNTTDGSVSTVVDRQFVANMPLNGRSFQSLIDLAPGITVAASTYANQGQFSVNGQRTDTNYFTVDGVSANAGVGTGGAINSAGGGALPLVTAGGGYNNLVSIDDLQEFRIHTSSYAPEFGRTPGAQVTLLTRSGTNTFHGDVFDYLRNSAFDANNWFSNFVTPNIPKPPDRQNDFGGVFGGPIVPSKLFFFASYEGLRLTNAQTETGDIVPSICGRNSAVSNDPNNTPSNNVANTAFLRDLLNAYPKPNAGDISQLANSTCPSGLYSFFNANLPLSYNLDSFSIRSDYHPSSRMSVFFRYSYAPSDSGASTGAILNTTHIVPHSFTFGHTYILSSTMLNDLRFNFTDVSAKSQYNMTTFDGGVPVSNSFLFPAPYTYATGQFLFSMGIEELASGQAINNHQQQFNLVDALSVAKGTHQMKFGVDWRQLTPRYLAAPYTDFNSFNPPFDVFNGLLQVNVLTAQHAEELRYENYSLYAQDTWQANPRLTLTYGFRWEISPAPTSPNGTPLVAINQLNLTDLSATRALPIGSQLYATAWANLAPRIGIAYSLSQDLKWGRVIRGGFGIFYDTASDSTSFTNGPYFPQRRFNNVYFPVPSTSLLPLPSVDPNPPYTRAVDVTDPYLSMPRTYEFNVALEQELGPDQALTTTYVGALGRNEIRNELFLDPSVDFLSGLSPYVNTGTSNYNALQLQFQRRLSHGLQVLAGYTWSHSIDNASDFSTGSIPTNLLPANVDRGNSAFDIRQQFNVAVTYNLPSIGSKRALSLILDHWSLDGIDHFRTALPYDITVSSFNYTDSNGQVYQIIQRPDVASGQSFYLYGTACTDAYIANGSLVPGQGCPGGKGLNPAAFATPPQPSSSSSPLPLRQGTLARDALRGFGSQELDATLRRDFPIHEQIHLEFRADVFNLLNHPNFGNPTNTTFSSSFPQGFGLSLTTLNNFLGTGNATGGGAGGFNPLYSLGGPRSIQLSLKLRF